MNAPSDTPSGSHYFSETPSHGSQPGEFSFDIGGTTLTLATDTGVFSRHGLDKGTRVLLDVMTGLQTPPPPPGSTLCDLGCGTGAIALALAVLHPDCSVIAVDVNERARHLCAANAARNNLTNVQVIAPGDFVAHGKLAVIWSNPPIRIGKEALHDLLSTWLSRLDDNGTAHLVVSKNLGADSLTAWLNNGVFVARKIASSKGFRVLGVCRA